MPEYVHKYIIPITITLIALIAFVVVFFILPKRREKSVKFCRALKSVVVSENISSIGAWTFKDCSALESVVFRSSFDPSKISATAFEGAKITADKITVSDSIDNNVTITITCVDENGAVIPGHEPKSETRKFGEAYSYVAPTIDGYSAEGEQRASRAQTERHTVARQ